jgi:exopolyphosphatase/guanosine-5'-triphosphate,3'-diphosphate pyrophosphatase
LKLAAIDIGSNAARLLISEVVKNGGNGTEFNKLNLVRVPLRLGFDVFEYKRILPEKEIMIVRTMQAYKYLLDVYEVKHYKACATSAMRDAVNSQEIIRRTKEETGIQIEVISGDMEASVLYESHVAETLDKEHSYLYIDVGGGSTELTLFSEGRLIFKQSFDIGTIRLLKNQVDDNKWSKTKDFIKEKTRNYKNLVAIGTGGNINKIFSMSKKKDGKPLPLELLKEYYNDFSNYGLRERMRTFNLREDRADVIVPALQIFINVMRWSNTDEILVPKIGLADGLIQHLYQELCLREMEV